MHFYGNVRKITISFGPCQDGLKQLPSMHLVKNIISDV